MPKNLKLKAARAEKDMTQAALAEAVGVSRQTINAIEKGEYNPTINLCRAICKALGKNIGRTVLGGTINETKYFQQKEPAGRNAGTDPAQKLKAAASG